MFSSCFLWGKSAGRIPPQARVGHRQPGLAGGSTRCVPVPLGTPNLPVLSPGDAPHHRRAPAPGRPCAGWGRMTMLRWHSHTKCPRHLAPALPVTGPAAINHSGRPGLHVNSAPGIILILQIDFSQTFIRKHAHGNSHPIQLLPWHTWFRHRRQILLLLNHNL